jgi:preprotein translocase subunit SecA
MAFITKILGKIFGNKSEKDIDEIMPLVEKIKIEYDRIYAYTNDQLREETLKLKTIIRDRIKLEEEEIASLKEKVEDIDIQESEKVYERIDKLEEDIIQKLEATKR